MNKQSKNNIEKITIPHLGESISSAIVSDVYKVNGESVRKNEVILVLETDKINLEIVSNSQGTISSLKVSQGDTVNVGQTVGTIVINQKAEREIKKKTHTNDKKKTTENNIKSTANSDKKETKVAKKNDSNATSSVSHKIKNDKQQNKKAESYTVPMSPMQINTAAKLKKSQNTAATTTTFNEINMDAVLNIRRRYNEASETPEKNKIGITSFFITASSSALSKYSIINACIKGNDIQYHNHCNISIAVVGKEGVVVPTIKNVQSLSIVEIEERLSQLKKSAQNSKLTTDDMTNGTFTISNGGVYGSLMSAPIINAPQSAILGLNAIQQRPVVQEQKICIANMMYVSLSYDHRIIDGEIAIKFLKHIKNLIENPEQLLFNTKL